MTYAISDIHGNYTAYKEMLRLIDFSAADTLYVIGDVIDRGSDGIEILQDIMVRSNIHFLLGNHEDMMLTALTTQGLSAMELWRLGNGGEITHARFLKLDEGVQTAILEFLSTSPLQAYIDIGGISYHLVHGMPAPVRKNLLWGRIHPSQQFSDDRVIISGHTPTAKYQSGTPYRMWFGKYGIIIDCGCVFPPAGRLGCLRLDDWEEFYC